MKKIITSLAGMLVLSLLTSVTLAEKPPAGEPALKYEPSLEQGVQPVWGVIDTCDIGGVLAKNVNSGISNANSAGNNTLALNVDGTQLNLYIEWELDNSFLFYFVDDQGVRNDSGTVYEMGIKNNTDDIIYKYGVDGASSDTELNDINVAVAGNIDADRANHLDLCLATGDSTPPGIVFEEPQQGDTVSGDVVTVIVTVTDESGLATDASGQELVFLSVDDGQTNNVLMDCSPVPGTQDQFECRADWLISELAAGPYTITVEATDGAVPVGNTATASVTVEVVKLFSDCFGTLEEGDFPGDPEPLTGCDPTDRVNIQAPPDNSACDPQNPDPPGPGCYISGTLLKPNPVKIAALEALGCQACVPGYCGDHGFPDPRTTQIELPSPEHPVGRWIPTTKRSLNIFKDVGIHPDQAFRVLAAVEASYPDDPDGPEPPQSLDNVLVLDDKTYCANGCCAIAQHVKGDFLEELYTAWPDINGLAFIKRHDPKILLGDDDLAAKCYGYDPAGDPVLSYDLQDAAGAGYQPLFQTADDSGFLTVLTQDCVNPARDLTRNNGFDVSNIIVSTAEPHIYVEDAPIEVLNFMYQQSEEDFVRVFFILDVIERDALVLTGNFRRDVRSPINQAKRRFDNFNTTSLQQSIGALIDAADGIRTKTTYDVTEANPPGEALALIEHLIWDLGLLNEELIRVEALP